MDFRKAFFPTKEENLKREKLLKALDSDQYLFWVDKGFSDGQFSALKEMESEEYGNLKCFEEYASRKSLLENEIISLESVINDIKFYVNDKNKRSV